MEPNYIGSAVHRRERYSGQLWRRRSTASLPPFTRKSMYFMGTIISPMKIINRQESYRGGGIDRRRMSPTIDPRAVAKNQDEIYCNFSSPCDPDLPPRARRTLPAVSGGGTAWFIICCLLLRPPYGYASSKSDFCNGLPVAGSTRLTRGS